ncbi:DUF892 family protein [Acinetobacter baumannii]
MVAYADACGLEKVSDLLSQTLEEEKQTDSKLNELAVGDINHKAIEAARSAA